MLSIKNLKNKIKYLLKIGFLFLLFSCSKEPTISNNISYLIDNNYSIENIDQQKFTVLKRTRLGSKNGYYWFKINLHETLKGIPTIFAIKGNTIDKLEIYTSSKKTADFQDNIDPINLAFQVNTTTESIYFIKVHFQKQAYFPLVITPINTYFFNEKLSYLKNGWYYGFVFMVIVVNLFFYFSIKHRVFLAYCFFVTFTNLGLTDYDGFIHLWAPQEMIPYIGIALHFLVPLSSGIFASLLLDHNKLIPKSKFTSIIIITIAIVFYGFFLATNEFIYFAIGDCFGLIFFTYYMLLGVFSLKTHEYAKFSVIGFSLVFLSAVSFIMPLNWGVFKYAAPLYSVKLGALFEMLILSYAITYRVKKIQEENDHVQNEIKEYLEKIYNLEEKLQNKESSSELEQKILELRKTYALTDRETDVLFQISKGLTNKQIAEKLFISVNTVKYHSQNLYEKLDIKKRTEITSKLIHTN